MSLFLQYIEESYFYQEYKEIKKTMKEFEKGQGRKPFPECVYRELDYAIAGSFRQTRDEKLFPIRFLLLFGMHEQRMFDLPVMGRCCYHPERLWEKWNLLLQDQSARQEAEQAGVLFDFQNKAISLTKGWVLIDTFVEDYFELERFWKKPMLFPDGNGNMKPIFEQYRKGGKKWIKSKKNK